jgi:hypothetical protein
VSFMFLAIFLPLNLLDKLFSVAQFQPLVFAQNARCIKDFGSIFRLCCVPVVSDIATLLPLFSQLTIPSSHSAPAPIHALTTASAPQYFATCLVTTATPTSLTNPNVPTVAFQYAIYRLFTSINASLGSSGPTSCFPSPKSPNYSHRPLLYSSLILESRSQTVTAVPAMLTQFSELEFWNVICISFECSRSLNF